LWEDRADQRSTLNRETHNFFLSIQDTGNCPDRYIHELYGQVRKRCSRMVNVSKEGQVFECEICGNVVVVKEVGGGELVCCGQPMNLIQG